MSRKPILEIAANSLASALAAQAGGADRVELCSSLVEGGITPSYATIGRARDQLQIPLYVLIRPRAGDFLYDNDELGIMRGDIERCARLGCDGVVIGALDVEGDVDVKACQALIDVAQGLGITFHRAFDAARDPSSALEAIVKLGCERVLTSGGCASAWQGADVIARLVDQAAGRIGIMAGAGIRPELLAELAARSHAAEFHASAIAPKQSRMRWQNDALQGLASDYFETDPATVRALVRVLSECRAEI